MKRRRGPQSPFSRLRSKAALIRDLRTAKEKFEALYNDAKMWKSHSDATALFLRRIRRTASGLVFVDTDIQEAYQYLITQHNPEGK